MSLWMYAMLTFVLSALLGIGSYLFEKRFNWFPLSGLALAFFIVFVAFAIWENFK